MATITTVPRARTRGATREKNWENWAALVGGSALAAFGLWRRSAPGIAMAAAGGFLAYRGATSDRPVSGLMPGRLEPIGIHHAVTIAKPAAELYSFWRNFENLPKFMRHLESVRSMGRTSHWKAKAPAGRTVEWDAEITDERENELIAWRSTGESDVQNWGRIRFQPAPGNRGTEVHVEMQYLPPGGELGRWFAKAFGEEPEMQIREDLRRFKQLMETGEIATTEGQSSGRRSMLARGMSRMFTEAERDREIERAG